MARADGLNWSSHAGLNNMAQIPVILTSRNDDIRKWSVRSPSRSHNNAINSVNSPYQHRQTPPRPRQPAPALDSRPGTRDRLSSIRTIASWVRKWTHSRPGSPASTLYSSPRSADLRASKAPDSSHGLIQSLPLQRYNACPRFSSFISNAKRV